MILPTEKIICSEQHSVMFTLIKSRMFSVNSLSILEHIESDVGALDIKLHVRR